MLETLREYMNLVCRHRKSCFRDAQGILVSERLRPKINRLWSSLSWQNKTSDTLEILFQFPSRKLLLQFYSPRSLEIACQAKRIFRQEEWGWWPQVQQHKLIPMRTHYQKKEGLREDNCKQQSRRPERARNCTSSAQVLF